jgi:hypothetical protein
MRVDLRLDHVAGLIDACVRANEDSEDFLVFVTKEGVVGCEVDRGQPRPYASYDFCSTLRHYDARSFACRAIGEFCEELSSLGYTLSVTNK